MGKDKEKKETKKEKKEIKKETKAKFHSDLLLRLQACLMWSENTICAECDERDPTMASLLMPPSGVYMDMFGTAKLDKKKAKQEKKRDKEVKKDKRKMMGVFCCKKCSSHHMLMGREVCEVKNIKMMDHCK